MVIRYLLINIILSILISISMFTVLILNINSKTDFFIYNNEWNGYLRVFREYDAKIIVNSLDYFEEKMGSDQDNVTIILLFYKPYSMDEVRCIKKLLSKGARIIFLSDISSYVNDVLRALDLNLWIEYMYPIVDPINNLGDPNIIYARSTLYNLSKIVLNIATPINTSLYEGNYSILIETYASSYIDIDNSGTLDPGEPYGSMIVGLKINVYGGELIIISDPDIIINDALTFNSNRMLLKYLIKGEVYLDQYHIMMSKTDELLVLLHRSLHGLPMYLVDMVLVVSLATIILYDLNIYRRLNRY